MPVKNHRARFVSGGSGTFDDQNVANGKTVTYTNGIALAGQSAVHYEPDSPVTVNGSAAMTANITPAPVTIMPGANQSKIDSKDSTTDPTFTYTVTPTLFSADTFTGVLSRVAGETVTGGPYSFDASTLSNANYSITLAANGHYTKPIITINGAMTANNKVYDGTTDAATNAAGFSPDGISGDTVTLIGGTFNFSDKNAGTRKTVTYSGFSLGGTDAGNYTVSTGITNPPATADIMPLKLVMNDPNLTKTKVYDTTVNAAVTASTPANLAAGDNVNVSATAAYDSASAGMGKTITVTYSIESGLDMGNYTMLDNYIATDSVIDANPTASAMTYGETVENTLLSGGSARCAGIFSFTTTGSALSVGTHTTSIVFTLDTTNYEPVTDNAFTVTVNPKPITVTPTAGQNKIYGSNAPTIGYTTTLLAYNERCVNVL